MLATFRLHESQTEMHLNDVRIEEWQNEATSRIIKEKARENGFALIPQNECVSWVVMMK